MFYPIKLIDRNRDLNSASVPYTLAFALHCTGRQAALTNTGLRVRGLSRCLLLTPFRRGDSKNGTGAGTSIPGNLSP